MAILLAVFFAAIFWWRSSIAAAYLGMLLESMAVVSVLAAAFIFRFVRQMKPAMSTP